jgi:glycosyltransferase involved in cell wall biosynthesis
MNKVSVIAATRNDSLTLKESLISIMSQSYKNIEIIVVDDSSTDNTKDIVKKLIKKDKRIKYYLIKHNKDAGCVIPRIYGIKKAAGDMLLIIDTDAKYSKDYIRTCVEYHKSHSECGGSTGKILVWDTSSWITKAMYVNYYLLDSTEKIKKGRSALWFIPKKIYYDIGGYNKNLSYSEDIDLAQRIIKKYKFKYFSKLYWHHRFEPNLKKIMLQSFNYGKKDVSYFKSLFFFKKLIYLINMIMNSFWPALLILIFFLSKPFFCLLFFVIWIKYIILFFKALFKNIKFAAYILLSPFISFIKNFSKFLGFFYSLFKK